MSIRNVIGQFALLGSLTALAACSSAPDGSTGDGGDGRDVASDADDIGGFDLWDSEAGGDDGSSDADAFGDTGDMPPDGSGNAAPIAVAGDDVRVAPGLIVNLNAVGSSDADDDPLTFVWRIVSPEDPLGAELADPNSIRTTFIAEELGEYVIELEVSDGTLSAIDTLVVTVAPQNGVPVADAGADLSATVDVAVQLDGTGSEDSDGDELVYRWTIGTRPSGAVAELDDDSLSRPTLVPDVAGRWELELVVADAFDESAPDTVVITAVDAPVDNPPIAAIRPVTLGALGRTLTLDGTPSSDPDGDTLAYTWTVIARPEGAVALLDDTSAATATLIPDVLGIWEFSLVVVANELESEPATVSVEVTAHGAAPIASAGTDRAAPIDVELALDGSASRDPELALLTYRWRLVSAPSGAESLLVGVTTVGPTITPDVAGNWVFELIVNDGGQDSAPDTVTIGVFTPPCLIFSEYIEGSSSNKALELYNCGSETYDFTNVAVCIVANSATACTSRLPLTGTLAAGDVYGICNSSLAAGLVDAGDCDVTSAVANFNGDDRLLLYREVDGTIGYTAGDELLDAIGDPLVQPPPTTFADVTLRRCQRGGTVFDEANYLRVTQLNDFSDFGIAPDFSAGCVVIPPNEPPVADAGPDVVTGIGESVELDGTASLDPEGDMLSFAWSVTAQPAGSNATLGDELGETTSFVADLVGLYEIELEVSDGLASSVDTVLVTVAGENTPPVAVAGADQQVVTSALVSLSAAASSDADGDLLTYTWRVTERPARSIAEVTPSGTRNVNASIVPDVEGIWVLELSATDGRATATDTLELNVQDVDCLVFSEYIEGSSSNKAYEIHNCSDRPQHLNGVRVCLIVNDATACSSTLTLTGTLATNDVFTVCNSLAAETVISEAQCDVRSGTTAFNGNDRLLMFVEANPEAGFSVGDTRIDAFGQTAVAPLSNIWENQTLSRCNSAAYLGLDAFVTDAYFTRFTVDTTAELGLPPTYGGCSSTNVAPTAGERADQTADVGDDILLDGTLASDADGVIVSWLWEIVAAPAGASAEIDAPGAASTLLTPDVAGTWTIRLTVTDDDGATATDQFNIVVGGAAADCLLISEYVEGSSLNKYVELYNCGDAVDLAPYALCIAANAATGCTSSIRLSGTIDAGGTIVLCNPSATLTLPTGVTCDVTSSTVINFNGDDRLALYRVNDATDAYTPGVDTLIDTFGTLGAQPSASPWADVTYSRCSPTPYLNDGVFDVLDYYEVALGLNNVSGLGTAPLLDGCPI